MLAFLQDISAEVQKAAREGKCWDTAEKELKMPKYATFPNYEAAWPFIVLALLRAMGPRHLSCAGNPEDFFNRSEAVLSPNYSVNANSSAFERAALAGWRHF